MIIDHRSQSQQPEDIDYSELVQLWEKTNPVKRKMIVIMLWMDQHPRATWLVLVGFIALLALIGLTFANLAKIDPLLAVGLALFIGVASGYILARLRR